MPESVMWRNSQRKPDRLAKYLIHEFCVVREWLSAYARHSAIASPARHEPNW